MTRESAAAGNWFVRKRMEWIAETLRVFGYINREHTEYCGHELQ